MFSAVFLYDPTDRNERLAAASGDAFFEPTKKLDGSGEILLCNTKGYPFLIAALPET
jgi:hypothetical protein